MNKIRTLVNTHIDQWLAAGTFVLPNEHDCLEFIVTEAGEALQAKMRLNQNYVRNNPGACTQHDIAIELFDTMMMCLVYERITGHKLREVKTNLSGTHSKILHRIIFAAVSALTIFDSQRPFWSEDVTVYVSRTYSLALALIEHLEFEPWEIATEKLLRKGFKNENKPV